MDCKAISENNKEHTFGRPEVHISGSSIIVGNRGGHVSASCQTAAPNEGNSQSAVNEVSENELIRIYRKLDFRHKIDFITRALKYEEKYDTGCVRVELTRNRYTKTNNGQE